MSVRIVRTEGRPPVVWADDRPARMVAHCDTCARRRQADAPITCDAFPDGIPLPIRSGEVDHLTPLEGDGGTVCASGGT